MATENRSLIAFYNEIDPYAAQWTRNLIDAGHIANGIIETQSIEGLEYRDLSKYTQAHFFSGIGVWSYALRCAGWPDDRPVWTGSCPCQPFSGAGKMEGVEDERHLWPAWAKLIEKHRPPDIFGEQVASADGLVWLDVVSSDLENMGYAFGVAVLPAASVGAPHGRHRLFFHATLANANDGGREGKRASRIHAAGAHGNNSARRSKRSALADASGDGRKARAVAESRRKAGGARRGVQESDEHRAVGGVGDTGSDGNREHARELPRDESQHEERETNGNYPPVDSGAAGQLADADGLGCEGGLPRSGEARRVRAADFNGDPGAVGGFWSGADWLYCRDGRWRPVEPGSFPLATGIADRVGQLRAYGNAITAPAATLFIRAAMSVSP